MTIQLKRLIVPLVIAGIIGSASIQPAVAGTDGPRCHIEFSQGEYAELPQRGEFIVRSAGRRGALGVWKGQSGDTMRVRVDPGEGKASKWQAMVPRHEYDLVRCETVR
jgi:hypothetical protein